MIREMIPNSAIILAKSSLIKNLLRITLNIKSIMQI